MTSLPRKEKVVKPKKKGLEKFKDEKSERFVNQTPKGQIKDFTEPMAESYNPPAVEAAWDAYWQARGLYRADEKDTKKEKFVIVIPPPNVTGTLHLGHALTCSIEDTIIRWHRMNGKNVLWVPGTDHAGIATQVVVEKKLQREFKKSRHDYGREDFVKEVWKWKNEHGDRICSQLRRLGTSVDWSRFRFTMDEVSTKAVNEAFVLLHEKKKIYRANRFVHWSCSLRTAISNLEVDKQEIDHPTEYRVPGYDKPVEFGVLHDFAYKFVDSDEEIIVSTTRVETMLGDVAVAVHPDDLRYKKFHGRSLRHPFIKDRKMKLVTDDKLVDMKFGSGAVKVTPAHDQNDFLCGERHQLEQINIFNDDGTINANGGVYAGKHRFHVRHLIIEDLKKLGLYKGKKPNKMAVGFCSRSGDVVEPVLRPQWWVDCKEMAAQGIKAVEKGELKIIPDFHRGTWFHWLSEIEDWCISRQLWWGHRIPAYFITLKGKPKGDSADEKYWVVARTEAEALKLASERFKVPVAQITLEQDPDVLDTWFSSGLFPFSTMKWPEQGLDLKQFYPGNLLETGHDILFFWVARMVMMGLELTGKLPFNTVYLHAMVRDKSGRKMTKSLGNVIDPIDVMEGISLQELHDKLLKGNLDPKEVTVAQLNQKKDFPHGIAECGADALRFGLLAYTTQGRDINLDIQRVVAYRQFCNKLWNATRFALLNFDENFIRPTSIQQITRLEKTFADRWILHRLSVAVRSINDAFAGYSFADATSAVYNFWKYDFCDHYLELIKTLVYGKTDKDARARTLLVLFTCLDYGLRLLHPMMPFVTEELYHRLPGRKHVKPDWVLNPPSSSSSSSPSASSSLSASSSSSSSSSSASPICIQCGRQFGSLAKRESHQKESGHSSRILASVHLGQQQWADFARPELKEKKIELSAHAESTPSETILDDENWRERRLGIDSIMIASYPNTEETKVWFDEEIDKQMELFKEIGHHARSCRASFGLTDVRVDIYISCTTTELYTLIEENKLDVKVLCLANDIIPINAEKKQAPPKGSVSTVVNAQIELFIPISGVVKDLGGEVIKLEKKRVFNQDQIEAIVSKQRGSNYEATADNIKQEHTAKLEEYKIEYSKIQKALQTFLSLMTPEQNKKYLEDKLKDRLAQKQKAENTIEKLEKNLPPPGSKEPPSKKTLLLLQEQKELLQKLEEEIQNLRAKL